MITNNTKLFLGCVSVLFLLLMGMASSSMAEDLLIIVPYKPITDIPIQSDELWLDYADILRQYKENTGLSTAVITLERIRTDYEHYRGIDEPERIKKAIYDYVKNRGVRYVMLVGDAGVFPVRYQFHGYSSADLTYWAWDKEGLRWYQYEGYGFKPCDAYYANLWDNSDPSKAFDSWDADGDRLWGELYYDNFHGIDGNTIHPDVAVGRVPCKTPDEFLTYIIKVMKYEFYSGLLGGDDDSSYQKFDLLLGGGWSNSQAVERSIAEALPDDHIPALLLGAEKEPWSLELDGDVTENVDPVAEIIRRVYLNHDEFQFPVLLNYSGHGNRNVWGEPEFGRSDVGVMSNIDMPVLALAPASCSTGQFATGGRHLHIPSRTDANGTDTSSMAEAFLTDNSVGGVIYIGAVTSEQPPALFWNQKFIEAMIDGASTAGDAFLYAMEEFIRHYNLDTANASNWIEIDDWPDSSVGGKWNWFPAARFDNIYKLLLFGDPSLRLNGVTLSDSYWPSTTVFMSNWVNLQDLNDASGGIHVHHVGISTSDAFGIVTTEYRLQYRRGDETSYSYGESRGGRDFDLMLPVSRSMEGEEYTLSCSSINYIGMHGVETVKTIGFDFTPPRSSIDISETNDPVTVDGETLSSVNSITITASDELSGVARIEYRYGSTGRINSAVSTHLTIDFECAPFANDLVFNYRAVDMAENAEEWHSVTLHRRSCSSPDPATLFDDFNIFQPLIDFPPSFAGGIMDFAINGPSGAQKPDYIRFEYDGPVNSEFKGGQWQEAAEATFNSQKGIWTASWNTEQSGIINGFYMVRAVAGFNGAVAPAKALGGSGPRESSSDPMILLIDNIDPDSYQFEISPAKRVVKPGDSLDIEVNFKSRFGTLDHARLGLLVDGALLDNLEQDKLLKTAANVKQGQNWDHRFTIQLSRQIEGMEKLKIGAFVQSDEVGLLMADPVYIAVLPPDVTVSGNVTDTDGRLISATLVLEDDENSFEAEATSEHGYQFRNVPAGDYELRLKSLPEGYRQVVPSSTSITVHAQGEDVSQNFICAPEDINAPHISAMSDWQTIISDGRVWGIAYDVHFGTGIKSVKVAIKDEIAGKWLNTGNEWQDSETWFDADVSMRYDSKGTECLSGGDCTSYQNRIKNIHTIFRPDNGGIVWTYDIAEPELLANGRKVILVKAVDNSGNTATDELRNIIIDADFEITESSTDPMTLAFDDRSSGPVIFRSWDFGDGHTGSGTSPVHTYAAGGTYKITLYVEGVDSSDSVTRTYTVSGSGIIPDIKANNMDQLDISVGGESVTLSLGLQSDGAAGQDADWWLVALMSDGRIVHYDLAAGKWVTGFDITDFTYQGPLFAFSLVPVFHGYTMPPPTANADFILPEGTSFFFFGVDTLMNGTLDMDYLKYDFVEINVRNP